MKYCEVCGKQLQDDEICVCEKYGFNREEYVRIAADKQSIADAGANVINSIIDSTEETIITTVDGGFERDMKIVNECIVPAEQEILVRQYNIAKLSTPILRKALGRLQITNKRIIFRAAGKTIVGDVITQSEFAIDEIAGVYVRTDYRFNIVVFILSCIAISLMTGVYNTLLTLFSAWVGSVIPMVLSMLVMLAVSVVLFFGIKRHRIIKAVSFISVFYPAMFLIFEAPNTFVVILLIIIAVVFGIVGLITTWLTGIVDNLSIVVRGKEGNVNVYAPGFLLIRPWVDTEAAMRELGAIINDFRKFGDAAIDKWRV